MQEEIEKKAREDAHATLKILRKEEKRKKKEVAVKKKVEKDAEKPVN